MNLHCVIVHFAVHGMTIILCYGKTTAILWELVRHLHSLPRCAVRFVPADHILLILMETALQAVTDSPGVNACSNYDTLNHHNDHCFYHCCTDRKDIGMALFPYKVYRILLENDSLYVPKSEQLWCCHVFPNIVRLFLATIFILMVAYSI